MAYYYSEAEDGYAGTVVQIVKGELRKIGDWQYLENDIEPGTKHFVGWYWHNPLNETRYMLEDETAIRLKTGKEPELFNRLLNIYNTDRGFFERIMDKMDMSVWLFQDERDRREAIAAHEASDVKYVIYDTNDRGYDIDEPIGSAVVRTTGDERKDKATAIKRYLAAEQGKDEEEVMGIGFYRAFPFDEYREKRDKHLADLREKLRKAEEAAIYEDV